MITRTRISSLKVAVFKGVAYGGVFEVLEQRQITPQIPSVAGTSAGAITATMMSLNYSAGEFLKIMMTRNFEKFEDGCDSFALKSHVGAVSAVPPELTPSAVAMPRRTTAYFSGYALGTGLWPNKSKRPSPDSGA